MTESSHESHLWTVQNMDEIAGWHRQGEVLGYFKQDICHVVMI